MVDRYEIFKELKRLIEFGDSHFENEYFNPFQILVSTLFTQSVTYLNQSNGNLDIQSISKESLLSVQKLKWKLKYLKDKARHNLNSYNLNQPVLFLPVEPTHISQMKPVFESLKDLNANFLIVTNRMSIFNLVKDSYNCIFLPKKVTLLPSTQEVKLIKLSKQVLSEFKQNASIPLPIDFIQHLIEKEMNSLVNLYEQFEKIVIHTKPSNVFVGNDSTREGRLMTFLARKKRNLKSYCLMHGSISGEPLDTYHQVDCFFTYGQLAFDDLVRNGISPSKLKVSGAPYMDKFLQSVETGIHPILIERLGLVNSKPYILITNSGPGHSTSEAHYQKTLDHIFELNKELKNVQWVIKLHRKDSLQNFKRVLDLYPNHTFHIIEHQTEGFPSSIFEWLQGASCLLTGCSTVAIEAMTLGVPVITMDYMNEFRNVDFIDQHATIQVSSFEELKTAVYGILTDKTLYKQILEKSKEFAHNYFYKGNMSASAFIAHELTT